MLLTGGLIYTGSRSCRHHQERRNADTMNAAAAAAFTQMRNKRLACFRRAMEAHGFLCIIALPCETYNTHTHSLRHTHTWVDVNLKKVMQTRFAECPSGPRSSRAGVQ